MPNIIIEVNSAVFGCALTQFLFLCLLFCFVIFVCIKSNCFIGLINLFKFKLILFLCDVKSIIGCVNFK